MRQLTQLELLLSAATTAQERYALLQRARCLSPNGRTQQRQVRDILNVWPADPPAGGPYPAPVGQPPVEEDIVQQLRAGGYLSEHGLAWADQWPGDWETVQRLRAELTQGTVRRWWARLGALRPSGRG